MILKVDERATKHKLEEVESATVRGGERIGTCKP